MPIFIVLLLVVGLGYQLFFRYEHWTGGPNNTIVYERDNLTGETHEIRPGEKFDFWARVGGQHKLKRTKDKRQAWSDEALAEGDEGDFAEPMLLNMMADPADKKRGAVVGAAAAAVGAAEEPKLAAGTHVALEREDLNGDGAMESVLRTKTVNDGLLDISVVRGSREVFYGRGKDLVVLPTRHKGWADLVMTGEAGEKQVFRFNPAVEGYEAVDPN
jgi:hypothetical protein